MQNNIIAISVQTTTQTCLKANYISYTILANQRTSIYSHELAILKDGKIHFQKKDLPSVSLAQLKHQDIDARTRKIAPVDKLASLFYLIYSGNRVGLQCLNPTHIEINGEEMWCDENSLQFIPFPRDIKVNGEIVLSVHIPAHFSKSCQPLSTGPKIDF